MELGRKSRNTFFMAEDNALHVVHRSSSHPATVAGFLTLSHFPADRFALRENPHGTFSPTPWVRVPFSLSQKKEQKNMLGWLQKCSCLFDVKKESIRWQNPVE